MNTKLVDGIPTITPEETQLEIGKTMILDVRRPDEFSGELGHIASARLVVLGPELEKFLTAQNPETPIIFVCRSGGRSAHATAYSCDLGFRHTANMEGGMLKWNQLGFKTEK